MSADGFGRELRKLAHEMVGFDRACRTGCGITLTQCQLVGELGRSGPCTLSELAAALGLDVSSTSRAVDAMVRRGTLRRRRDAADRRKVVISLSAAGRDLLAEIEASARPLAAAVQAHVPAGQLGQLREAMALLREALRRSAAAINAQCSRDHQGGS